MQNDTISRDAVLKRIVQFSVEEGSSVECQPLYSDVNNMPSVQPSEDTMYFEYMRGYDKGKSKSSRKGHWKHFAQSDDCSECGYSTGKYGSPSNFCPNCGADMRGIKK